jgi:hypothetical protein
LHAVDAETDRPELERLAGPGASSADGFGEDSHSSWSAGAISTGMRSWIAWSVSFAVVVTMVKVAIASPPGPRHSSHRPASASGAPETNRTK